jgi:primosomal replication protein N
LVGGRLKLLVSVFISARAEIKTETPSVLKKVQLILNMSAALKAEPKRQVSVLISAHTTGIVSV